MQAQANKQKKRERKRNQKANGVVASPLKPHSKLTNKKWVKKQEQKKRFAEKERSEKAIANSAPAGDDGDIEMVDSRKVEKNMEKKEKAKMNKKARKGSMMKE